ncbi:MAG TPA: hypothetical protein VGA78_05730 [Gemmatimonadales bacterium]
MRTMTRRQGIGAAVLTALTLAAILAAGCGSSSGGFTEPPPARETPAQRPA